MNEKILKRQVDKDKFYYIYLKTLNGHLGLTKRELEVLVRFCEVYAKYLNDSYSIEEASKLTFCAASREAIRTELKMSPFNLNNVIKTLRDRQLVLTNLDKSYTINPRIFVSDTDTEYSINFKIQIT